VTLGETGNWEIPGEIIKKRWETLQMIKRYENAIIIEYQAIRYSR
jgi:hypothetical protein